MFASEEKEVGKEILCRIRNGGRMRALTWAEAVCKKSQKVVMQKSKKLPGGRKKVSVTRNAPADTIVSYEGSKEV